MNTLRSFLGWYLGLKVPRPGEGTEWRFDWRWPEPHWLVLLICVAVFVFVVDLYRREGESLNWTQRLGMIALRLATFLLILGMLTEPSLTIERTGLPIVAVMVDTSASMSLEDQYPANSKASQLAQESAHLAVGDANRLAIVKHLLSRQDGQLISALQQSHQLRFYQFSETARQLESGEPQDDRTSSSETTSPQIRLQDVIAELNQLKADGEQTRPAPSLKKVMGDQRGAPPAAIVVFTDGVASLSETELISTVAESTRRKGIQFHLIGVGSESASKDLHLYDTLVDEVAFIGDPILFRAKLRAFGYAGRSVKLRLRHEHQSAILAEQNVVAPADGETANVEITYTSDEAGEFDFVLEVAEQDDESNRINNSEIRHISVREEKIRVLLADGAPRYEFRFLKQLLERDKSMELSTLLQEADIEYAQEDRTAIPHFPVKSEDLARFDVMILGDLDPAQLGFTALENLRNHVRDHGGSVVMIAGSQFNPLAFAGTALESLLPFDLSAAKLPNEQATDEFLPELTIEGQKGNSLFRLGNSESESLAIWNGLPKLRWLLEISKVKAGARVFAEQPTKAGSQLRFPVILMQQVGAGKVLYHATDESWRWRFRTGDLYHGRYWVQAIRYLSRSRLIGKDRTAELTVDQLVYQRGQPTTFRVKFVDEKFIPTDSDGVTVTVERKGEGRQTVKLTRLRELTTAFEGQLARLPEGTYRLPSIFESRSRNRNC